MFASALRTLHHISSYLRHYIRAGNEHDVHSPFVFKLLTEGIYVKNAVPVFDKIENTRKKLLNDSRLINVTDLGAGSSFDGRLHKRSIREIAHKFAKSPRHCRFLYRMTAHLQPAVMVELGTSLGISAMYQSSGNPNGKLYTLEGCPETSGAARENFINGNFNNIECITGNFDDTLPVLLDRLRSIDYAYIDGNHTYEATLNYFRMLKKHVHPQSVIIFDDIYWSEGMKQAWQEIKSDPEVTISLDFYQFGVIFFNKNFTKQNFRLRLWNLPGITTLVQ